MLLMTAERTSGDEVLIVILPIFAETSKKEENIQFQQKVTNRIQQRLYLSILKQCLC